MKKNRVTVIVACVGAKHDKAAPAARLYNSDWFAKASAYAQAHGDNWFILSAEHGLLDPNTVIEPYDTAMTKIPTMQRSEWMGKVIGQMIRADEQIHQDVIMLAGAEYRRWSLCHLAGWLDRTVHIPMQGMGIGRQLSWLKQSVNLFTGQIGLAL